MHFPLERHRIQNIFHSQIIFRLRGGNANTQDASANREFTSGELILNSQLDASGGLLCLVALATEGDVIRIRAKPGAHGWMGILKAPIGRNFTLRADPGAVLGGNWLLPLGSRGSFADAGLAWGWREPARSLYLRSPLMQVEGGPWRMEACGIWLEQADGLVLEGGAEVLLAACTLSGMDTGERRGGDGVALWDRSRCLLRDCLLRGLRQCGLRVHDLAEAEAEGCSFAHCGLSTAIGDGASLRLACCVLGDSDLGNLHAVRYILPQSRLELHGCLLQPSRDLDPYGPQPPANGQPPPRDLGHWLGNLRPGRVVETETTLEAWKYVEDPQLARVKALLSSGRDPGRDVRESIRALARQIEMDSEAHRQWARETAPLLEAMALLMKEVATREAVLREGLRAGGVDPNEVFNWYLPFDSDAPAPGAFSATPAAYPESAPFTFAPAAPGSGPPASGPALSVA